MKKYNFSDKLAIAGIFLLSVFLIAVSFIKYNTFNIDFGVRENNNSSATKDASLMTETKVFGYSTEISGLIAGNKHSEIINVSGCFGRELDLQMFKNGEWKKASHFTLPDIKECSISITYPDEVWQSEQTKWRFFIAESDKATQFVSQDINATSVRRFQNSSEWLQISDAEIPYAGERGRVIEPGFMGTRVAEIRKALGLEVGREVYYSNDAVVLVKKLQQENGMNPSGNVDLATWKLLGLSPDLFKDMDNNTHKLMANRSMTRDELIETMISTAMEYKGNHYITGASGSNKYGVDCSGLILQAFYGIGINPLPSNAYRHVEPDFEYESRQLWSNSKIMHVDLNERQRGDLIFYKSSKGEIIHVAIYLGNDMIIDSLPDEGVEVASMTLKIRTAGVGRPIV